MISVAGFVTATTMLAPLLVDIARDLDITLSQAGLLSTAMAIPWAFGAPFTGLLSDRVGRRPMIVIALVGVGVMLFASALAPTFLALLVLRFLTGLIGAFGPPSVMASVGDLVQPSRRGRAMGWLNMGFSVAAVVTVPAVGAVGGLLGWRWAFVFVAVVLLPVAFIIHRAFPPPGPRRPTGTIFAIYQSVFRVPRLANVLAANLLERSIAMGTALYLPPFLILTYDRTALDVAPALSLVAFGALSGNVVGGWLADRFSKALLFVAAQIVAGMIALVVFQFPLTLLVSAGLGAAFGLANSASRPGFLALGSELSARDRGAVLGLLSFTNQGGVALGSAVGGLAIGLGGYPAFAYAALIGSTLAAALALPLARRD